MKSVKIKKHENTKGFLSTDYTDGTDYKLLSVKSVDIKVLFFIFRLHQNWRANEDQIFQDERRWERLYSHR